MTNEMKAQMSLDNLGKYIAAEQQRVRESDLSKEKKDEYDAKLVEVLDRVSKVAATGNLLERVAEVEEQKGQPRPGHDPVGDFIKLTKAWEENKGSSKDDPLRQVFASWLKDQVVNKDESKHDPLREVFAAWIKDQVGKPKENQGPVSQAMERYLGARLELGLKALDTPGPDTLSKLRELQELRRTLEELWPRPEGTPASMSPNDTLSLELKRLDVQERIERYKAEKQAEVDMARSRGIQDVAAVLGNLGESVGRGIAEYAQQSTPASPGRAVEERTTTRCPSCGQQAVFVSRAKLRQIQGGANVRLSCAACGAQHTAGKQEGQSASPSRPPLEEEPEEAIDTITIARGS